MPGSKKSVRTVKSSASLRTTQQEGSPCRSRSEEREGDLEIIVYEETKQQMKDDLDEIARSTVLTALDPSSLRFGQRGETLIYRNEKGVSLIEELGNLKADMRRGQSKLDHHIQKHEQQMSALQEQVSQSSERVQHLSQASEGYLNIRHRFLDVYRRDMAADKSEAVRASIALGNVAAHNGDAVTDAGLFKWGNRKDFSSIFKLYGLTPDQILLLAEAKDAESLAIINIRGTMTANRKEMSEAVTEALNNFIFLLETRLGESPTKYPTSELGRAYYRFWEVYR